MSSSTRVCDHFNIITCKKQEERRDDFEVATNMIFDVASPLRLSNFICNSQMGITGKWTNLDP